MSGITRININSNWSDWRTTLSDVHSPLANEIYINAFQDIGLPLENGVERVVVTKSEAISRYDWQEGIDVILTFESGVRGTLQEKFLTFGKNTATFEERKTSGSPGAWYYCTAQYYFVGYTRRYWNSYTRKIFDKPVIDFQEWIILDFPALQRASARDEIEWYFAGNQHDGRRATFRYVYFQNIPLNCIISAKRDYIAGHE